MADLGSKVKVLNYNEAVEVVFQGTNILGAGYHPMHLHGHSFYVVGSGYGNYNNDTDPKKFNLVDPVAVNTFGVPKNGWLAIRFVANNPGTLFYHYLVRLVYIIIKCAYIRDRTFVGSRSCNQK